MSSVSSKDKLPCELKKAEILDTQFRCFRCVLSFHVMYHIFVISASTGQAALLAKEG